MCTKRAGLLIATVFFVGLSSTGLAQNILFDHVTVAETGPPDPWAKILADIDGDGRLDIAIGGRDGPLVWYHSPDWTKKLIAVGGYQTVDGEAGDIDGDGDSDLVLGGLVWYENPKPSRGFDAPWQTHRIAEHKTHDVELDDLDGDGDLDIVTRDQSAFGDPNGNEIHLWLQEGPDHWTHERLACRHGEGLSLADLDLDGDRDILINGFWFENQTGGWVEHKVTDWHHSSSVAAGDINADGRPDLILVPSELRGEIFRISWFEALDARIDRWVEHIISLDVEAVYHSLQVSDMDGDGWLDIITAEMHQGVDPDEVIIYLNRRAGASWDKRVISLKGSHGLQVGDLDGDGRLDVMGANWSGPYQPVELWLNGTE